MSNGQHAEESLTEVSQVTLAETGDALGNRESQKRLPAICIERPHALLDIG